MATSPHLCSASLSEQISTDPKMAQELTPMQQQQLLRLSTSMNILRQQEHLTDVVIVCGEQRFPANKVVLAASTPFFAERFADNASDKKCIELQPIPAEIMTVLMEFMYTGCISFDVTDVKKLTMLFAAANELKLSSLAEHCINQLLQRISCAEVVQLWKMTDIGLGADLRTQLTKHIAQNIFQDCDAVDLHKLPLDCFIEILASNDLCVESADNVLSAILNWVGVDPAQRACEIKLLLPHVNKKGLSDESLFKMQQTDIFRTSPDLLMFALEIMTPRYRSLSSLRGSTCSLFSESSEGNDVASKEINEELSGEKAGPTPTTETSTNSKDAGPLAKPATSRGKEGDILPAIKEENVLVVESTLENSIAQSAHGTAVIDNFSRSLALIQKPSSPPVQKTIPVSTSPPVKDTSPTSTPIPVNNINLGSDAGTKKALEVTPLLLTPSVIGSPSLTGRSPPPHDVLCKPNPVSENVKPKESPVKSQRTVANLSLLTVCKKQPNSISRQSNSVLPLQQFPSRGAPTEKMPHVDNDRFRYDENRSRYADRNRSSSDLFTRTNAAIRSYESNRNYGPNGNFDRNYSSFDRNPNRNGDRYVDRCGRDPFPARDAPRHHEPPRSQEPPFQPELNRKQDKPNCNDQPVVASPVTDPCNESATAKSRLPVSVSTSQQAEWGKDVYFILQKDNDWSLESFSTETDEWSKPKPIARKLYQHSTVISVGHVIYFMGGTTEAWEVLKTVLMYNIRTNEWRTVADMQVARWGAGGAQLQAYIYIVGGVSDVNTRLNHVERYNPLTDKWSSIAPLLTCREQPSVTSVHSRLFVIGGYVILPQQWQMRTIETKPTATGEVYNPTIDQWTELDTPLNIGREVLDKTFCTTAIGDRLFAIRLHVGSLELPKAEPLLHEYNLPAKQWFRHAMSDPELMSVAHVCCMNDEQLCLVSGKGNVYIFQSINNPAKELLKCCNVEKKGLVYAVVPSVSKQ